MSTVSLTVAMPSDWLKSEAKSWYSRENGVLAFAQTTGGVLSGTVLAKNGTGNLVILDPASTTGTQNAVGILLFSQAESTVDLRVAYIARQAIVADKALRFPAGTTGPQKTTTFAALEALGILVREGV